MISAVPRAAKNAEVTPKNPTIERPDPEIEQVAADQRPAADPVFTLEAQHGHGVCPIRVD